MTIVDRRFSVAEGTAFKAPCRAATTANITLSGEQTIDGIAIVADDRVLVKDQTNPVENGIYSCSTGSWTRTRDFDGAYDVVTGSAVYVTSGTVSCRQIYLVSSTGTLLPGTSSIAFQLDLSSASAVAAAASAAAALVSQSSATASASAASTSATSAASSAAIAVARVPLTRAVFITTSIDSAVTTLETSGYYTTGDFGAGRYKKVGSAPSHSGYFQSLDGAYWELAETEPCAAQFGVKGDNSAVAGDMTAETAAINAFLSYLGGTPYSTGYLHGCSGNFFRTNSSLYAWPNTTVRCPAFNATIYANFSGQIIAPVDPTTQRTNGFVMHGGLIIDGGYPTYSCTGMSLQNASEWDIHDIQVQNVVNGFDVYNTIIIPLDASNYNNFTNCTVSTASNAGWLIEPNANSNTIFMGRATGCTYGVLDQGNDNAAIRCQFETGTTAVWCRNGADAWVTATAYVVGNYVVQGGGFYRCLVNHTSGVFATDLASVFWLNISATSYYSQNFSSISNRFEGWTTGHSFDAEAVNPVVISPYYQSVTTNIFNNIVTTGNKPSIFGVDGIGAGSNGSWFKYMRLVAADVTFTSINGLTSQDQFYNTGVLDLDANDFVAVMNSASLGVSFVLSAVPAAAGFYVRCTNVTAGALTPGALTVPCLVMKLGAS